VTDPVTTNPVDKPGDKPGDNPVTDGTFPSFRQNPVTDGMFPNFNDAKPENPGTDGTFPSFNDAKPGNVPSVPGFQKARAYCNGGAGFPPKALAACSGK
jgi:hypothetical protein